MKQPYAKYLDNSVEHIMVSKSNDWTDFCNLLYAYTACMSCCHTTFHVHSYFSSNVISAAGILKEHKATLLGAASDNEFRLTVRRWHLFHDSVKGVRHLMTPASISK